MANRRRRWHAPRLLLTLLLLLATRLLLWTLRGCESTWPGQPTWHASAVRWECCIGQILKPHSEREKGGLFEALYLYTRSQHAPRLGSAGPRPCRTVRRWPAGLSLCVLQVRNPLPFAVELFWVDDTFDETRLLELGPGETVPQNTFVGHVYLAKRLTGEVVDWWSMSGAPLVEVQDKAADIASSCQVGGPRRRVTRRAPNSRASRLIFFPFLYGGRAP